MPITLEHLTVAMPQLGPENTLPMVGALPENPYAIAGTIPGEIVDGSTYGNPANLFPYSEQNGFDRTRVERELDTVVLQNSRLRAVFLPQLGGRLWELFDRSSGKQLLHTPPSIQFANLALRNAWFAGGIEWNIGTRGHSPTTCSPLHTAVLQAPDGTPVLRMWEFERMRGVVFQIDAWLPEDSPVLFVAVRIRNPSDAIVPMYWWTNAAVPQERTSRVVAPADTAFATHYSGAISRVIPMDDDGIDCTWPARNRRARDFFFDIPSFDNPSSDSSRRPWIANVDGDGDGLAMVSTPRMRGRKLFVWGTGPGGNRWQDWLGPDGGRYAEIQAGLAQTQFEHLAMPAGAQWRWVEAFGNARVDASIAHGSDWVAAREHVAGRLDDVIPPDRLAAAQAAAETWSDLAPDEIIHRGSGWGALESARRARDGSRWIDETGTPFGPGTLGVDQYPWMDVLNGSDFHGSPAFVAGESWEARLASVEDSGDSVFHRAVMAHARGARDLADACYHGVLELNAPASLHAQAHRGLAMLAASDAAARTEHYRQACAFDPANTSLLIEAAAAAIAAGRGQEAIALIEATPFGSEPPAPNRHPHVGRIRLLHAQARAQIGERERAAGILRSGIVVADLREGANAMAALWGDVIDGEPVPAEYQFSMTEQAATVRSEE